MFVAADRVLPSFMPMQAVSYSEANENLEAIIYKVVADRAPLAITRQRAKARC